MKHFIVLLLSFSLIGLIATAEEAVVDENAVAPAEGLVEEAKPEPSKRELARFDKDKDGTLNEEEQAAYAAYAAYAAAAEKRAGQEAARLEKFDADGDGKLSKEERAAAKEAMSDKKGKKGKKGKKAKGKKGKKKGGE